MLLNESTFAPGLDRLIQQVERILRAQKSASPVRVVAHSSVSVEEVCKSERDAVLTP